MRRMTLDGMSGRRLCCAVLNRAVPCRAVLEYAEEKKDSHRMERNASINRKAGGW